jgi:hypothetical protein
VPAILKCWPKPLELQRGVGSDARCQETLPECARRAAANKLIYARADSGRPLS